MKKLITLMTCLLLLLAMAVPALAEDDLSQPGGDTPEPNPPHQHSWTEADSATCTDAGTITRSCSCGVTETVGASPAKGHSWDAGTVTRKATCQQTGETTYTCSACQQTRTEEIPMSPTHAYGDWTYDTRGHKRICADCLTEEADAHILEKKILKMPTCGEEGTQKNTCATCGYSETMVLAKLTEHTYDSACDRDCNVCGAIRSVSHNFTTSWSKDYKGHWHECTKCGEKKDEGKHVPGPEATEETEQVCKTCGYVIAPKKQHTHNFGKEWTSDEVGHWHACTRCKEEKNYASHMYDNDCDGECNICGYKRANSHTYEDDWQTTKFDHWNICKVCGEESKKEKHTPGDEASEEAAQLCTVCGYELAPKLEHTHDFGNVWFQDEINHWQECTCGELSVPLSHVWDEGKENRNDTITYTCADCGFQKTEAAPSSGFPWLMVFLVILAIGCLGGIAVLVYMLKHGEFDQEDDADSEEEEAEDFPEEPVEEDQEEKMIDDYFASLDHETQK